jgi:hypothetical protein
MDKRQATKNVLHLVTEYGVGIIVTAIIKNNTAPTRIDKKISVFVAGLAIGGVVSNRASKYMDAFVDEIFDAYAKTKAARK